MSSIFTAVEIIEYHRWLFWRRRCRCGWNKGRGLMHDAHRLDMIKQWVRYEFENRSKA